MNYKKVNCLLGAVSHQIMVKGLPYITFNFCFIRMNQSILKRDHRAHFQSHSAVAVYTVQVRNLKNM